MDHSTKVAALIKTCTHFRDENVLIELVEGIHNTSLAKNVRVHDVGDEHGVVCFSDGIRMYFVYAGDIFNMTCNIQDNAHIDLETLVDPLK